MKKIGEIGDIAKECSRCKNLLMGDIPLVKLLNFYTLNVLWRFVAELSDFFWIKSKT